MLDILQIFPTAKLRFLFDICKKKRILQAVGGYIFDFCAMEFTVFYGFRQKQEIPLGCELACSDCISPETLSYCE